MLKHIKKFWKIYAFWIALTEGVGALSGWLTRKGVERYNAEIIQPPFSPPSWVFPIVWSTLFALLGFGAARVWLSPDTPARRRGLVFFWVQLIFNFFWSILFFNFQVFGAAFLWLAALWGQILGMLVNFRRSDRLAGWLQLPYLLWVGFAAYLNLGVWWLNR